jgi:hypothetical protein
VVLAGCCVLVCLLQAVLNGTVFVMVQLQSHVHSEWKAQSTLQSQILSHHHSQYK